MKIGIIYLGLSLLVLGVSCETDKKMMNQSEFLEADIENSSGPSKGLPSGSNRKDSFNYQTDRGTVIESKELAKLSNDELNKQFAPLGLKAQYGVKVYRVVYQTVSPRRGSSRTKASMMVAVPDVLSPVFPWILLNHYTLLGDKEAPSVQPFIGLFEASQGFVAVVPDNLGYGVANDVYPTYLFAKGYSENGIDALRAARSFSKSKNLNFGPLFLAGYSEGGYATLAFQQSLETKHSKEFPLAGSAPVAGPYDLTILRQALNQPEVSSVFINNLILSYEAWLNPKLHLNDIYVLDVEVVRKLYDGSKTTDEIRLSLPSMTKAIFQAKFIDDLALQKPQSREARSFVKLLQENTLPQGDWTPKTPTRFFHCNDDDIVPVSITQVTVARLQGKGKNPPGIVTAEILNSPNPAQPYSHTTCPLFYSYLSFFSSILPPTK